MRFTVKGLDDANEEKFFNFVGVPSKCPYCFDRIQPTPLFSYYDSLYDDYQVVLVCCPNPRCKKTIIAKYVFSQVNNTWYYSELLTRNEFYPIKFDDHINQLSNMFVIIYNQALHAEEMQLFEICGPGYRKALEFLIKDYCIQKYPDSTENIKKLLLKPCIVEYVPNEKIKDMAIRAAYIGNDETHYVKKWMDKDLKDLKALIDLTLHWISMEILYDKYQLEMKE